MLVAILKSDRKTLPPNGRIAVEARCVMETLCYGQKKIHWEQDECFSSVAKSRTNIFGDFFCRTIRRVIRNI